MHEAFEITKKYVSGTELRNNGLSYYKISKLVEAGKLKKINHTTYENLLYNGEEHDFFYGIGICSGRYDLPPLCCKVL